ncbi:hypothetical protein ONZ45_g6261 [Pleurotus djamor]|nr:hypothetical protein ONZ45_g6261 [Pleurotus djamor]
MAQNKRGINASSRFLTQDFPFLPRNSTLSSSSTTSSISIGPGGSIVAAAGKDPAFTHAVPGSGRPVTLSHVELQPLIHPHQNASSSVYPPDQFITPPSGIDALPYDNIDSQSHNPHARTDTEQLFELVDHFSTGNGSAFQNPFPSPWSIIPASASETTARNVDIVTANNTALASVQDTNGFDFNGHAAEGDTHSWQLWDSQSYGVTSYSSTFDLSNDHSYLLQGQASQTTLLTAVDGSVCVPPHPQNALDPIDSGSTALCPTGSASNSKPAAESHEAMASPPDASLHHHFHDTPSDGELTTSRNQARTVGSPKITAKAESRRRRPLTHACIHPGCHGHFTSSSKGEPHCGIKMFICSCHAKLTTLHDLKRHIRARGEDHRDVSYLLSDQHRAKAKEAIAKYLRRLDDR